MNDNQNTSSHISLSPDDARELIRLLGLLGNQTNEAARRLSHFGDPVSYNTSDVARWSLLFRETRTKFLPRSMFGEPAWDLLLALFVHDNGVPVAVTDLAKLAETPVSTAVRWMDYLEEKGLVRRERSDLDRRVSKVTLSDEGRRRLDAYFADVIGQFSLRELEKASNEAEVAR